VELLTRIATTDETVRFAIYAREDGLLRVDAERLREGDEYTGPYWSFDQIGLFGTKEDVANFLTGVSPRPTENWPD
jgi:hypothetical protein